MPLYAYRCSACGSEEEHIERFSDPPKAACDACGGALERLLTPTAFHLKGGGWYKDGYASSKPASSGGGDTGSGSSSGGDSKPSSGGDSKPSSGGETKSSSKAAAE